MTRRLWIGMMTVCTLFQAPAQVSTFHNFGDDNLFPTSGLTEIADGVFVGGAYNGKSAPVLYTLTHSGTLTQLYTLPQINNACTTNAVNRPIQASDGNLYGTVSVLCGLTLYSYAYRLTLTGVFNGLKVFPTSVSLPHAMLLEGRGGALWGGEIDGVYRLSKSGTYTLVSSIFNPIGSMALGADGSIYGASPTAPGTIQDQNGEIFQINPAGNLSVLYTFPNTGSPTDPARPNPVILGTDGALYGTTEHGGANFCGTIFKINLSSGAYVPLLDMPTDICVVQGADADQSIPLMEAQDGSFFGVALVNIDTSTPSGTVFQFFPASGTVRSFGAIDQILWELTQPVSGGIVGTTLNQARPGFAYSISGPPPAPLISFFSQSSGSQGSTIVIRGNYLLGATSVSFNGTSATFQLGSVNAIVAQVPNGATTGPVTVVTPYGTATSPTSFTVL